MTINYVFSCRWAVWLGLTLGFQVALDAAETTTATPNPVPRLREAALAAAAAPVASSNTGVIPPPLPVLPAGVVATPQPIGATTGPFGGGALPRPQAAPVPQGLQFDSLEKITYITNGAPDATFTFSVTNVAKEDITIMSVHTSCGCTAAKLPQQPWVLHPGDHGEVGAVMHVAGKWGTVIKTVTIVSSQGSYPLTVRSVLPEANLIANQKMSDRSKNLQIAAADRQAVFRNDCATCHVQPAVGKTGKELYVAACGVCHEAEHKATMVPTLAGRTGSFPESYWNQWVRSGKVGSLMPAFELKEGGPLTEDQIQSLTAYLANEFLLQPAVAKPDSLIPPSAPVLNSAPLK